MKTILTAGAFVLGVICAMPQPVPCEVQAQLFQTKEPPRSLPVPGVVDEKTAAENSKWIESQPPGDVHIPAGTYWFYRGIRCQPGQRIRGAGVDRTFIRNAYTYAPFGDNCSIQVLSGFSPGFGYANGITISGQIDRNGVSLNDPADQVNYDVGTLVFTWKWDGYADGQQNKTRVRAHRVVNKIGPRLTLDSAPDSQATAINWTYRGVRIEPVAEKSIKVRPLKGEALGADWTLNKIVRVTGGPTSANEMVGETRRITSLVDGFIVLDRPLRKSYGASASVVLEFPVTDVAISDLTIERPPHQDTATTYFAHCFGLRFERVRVVGDFQTTLSSRVRLRDCLADGTIYFNGSSDADVDACDMRHAYLEEDCFDIAYRNSRISMPVYGGFTSNYAAPSERVELINMTIEGARDIPIMLTGRECLLDNVRIQGSQNPVDYVNSYIGGDDFQVRGLVSDIPVVVQHGRGVSLNTVRSTLILGWPQNAPPVGTAIDCPKLSTLFLPDPVKAQWAFAANAPASSTAAAITVRPIDLKKPIRTRPKPKSIKP